MNTPAPKKETSMPHLYDLIFLNDEKIPFDFIKQILIFICNKNENEAIEIIQEIQKNKEYIIASYIKEIAITKKNIIDINMLNNKYPINCYIKVHSS